MEEDRATKKALIKAAKNITSVKSHNAIPIKAEEGAIRRGICNA